MTGWKRWEEQKHTHKKWWLWCDDKKVKHIELNEKTKGKCDKTKETTIISRYDANFQFKIEDSKSAALQHTAQWASNCGDWLWDFENEMSRFRWQQLSFQHRLANEIASLEISQQTPTLPSKLSLWCLRWLRVNRIWIFRILLSLTVVYQCFKCLNAMRTPPKILSNVSKLEVFFNSHSLFGYGVTLTWFPQHYKPLNFSQNCFTAAHSEKTLHFSLVVQQIVSNTDRSCFGSKVLTNFSSCCSLTRLLLLHCLLMLTYFECVRSQAFPKPTACLRSVYQLASHIDVAFMLDA